MIETTRAYRDHLKVLDALTEAQRTVLAEAERSMQKAFEAMQSAGDLDGIKAAIKRVEAARTDHAVAKTFLIVALETELNMVKFGLEGQS